MSGCIERLAHAATQPLNTVDNVDPSQLSRRFRQVSVPIVPSLERRDSGGSGCVPSAGVADYS